MSAINVIVPVYNCERYLPELFDSLEAQTFTDFTLIVVDDASTDGSAKIIEERTRRLAQESIVLHNPTSMKAGPSRNAGLEEARKHPAAFTAFLDADDTFDPDYLQVMYEFAATQDVDLVICGMSRFDDGTGRELLVEAVDGPAGRVENLAQFDDLAFINPAPYGKLFRSSCLQNARFRNMRRSEDTCFFFDVLPKLSSLVYVNEAKYHYRLRSDSLTGAFSHEICESMFEGFEDAYAKFETGEYAPFREMFEAQIFIRTAIGGVCRLSFEDMSRVRANVREELEFMDRVMPAWRHNRYLSFGKQRSGGRKPFALKVCGQLYKMHSFGAFVRLYRFYTQVLKKDVRM